MIVHYANTFVGKRGNIGLRTARILKLLASRDEHARCICRGATVREAGIRYSTMGLLGHMPRLLNAYRIYVSREFNHRPADIAIFEHFAGMHVNDGVTEVAHVWDTCPRLIGRLKSKGARVILDVPIAPMTYCRRMRESGNKTFIADDARLIDIELEAFDRADVLVSPSDFVADELVLAGVSRAKIRVIEFGADRLVAKGGPRRHAKQGLDFCIIGALSRRKGVLELISAWSDSSFAEDRLHLCGRLTSEVADAVAASRLSNIILPGFVRPEIYLNTCDVFVLPSWMEGSSKAVYEAMSCGLPSVVTRETGSIIEDGVSGFLIRPGDVSALRDRLLWFKRNRQMMHAMGLAAKQRVAEYTWERYSERVVALYSSND